jgi:hypothetical protein
VWYIQVKSGKVSLYKVRSVLLTLRQVGEVRKVYISLVQFTAGYFMIGQVCSV